MIMNRAELITEKLLTPVLSELKIKNYTLEINSGSAKGDGYLGDIWSVKVHHPDGDLELIVKTATTNETQREITGTNVIFKNEINLYTVIFPQLDSLQRDKQVKHPLEMTKCYGGSLTEPDEAMVLQNLRADGYVVRDKRNPFDEAHIELALNYYARLHALSFALCSQRPEVFKNLANCVENPLPIIFPNFVDAAKERMRWNAQMLRDKGLVEEAEAAERIIEDAENVFFINEGAVGEYRVFVHGDCWNNNMLFKYDEATGKPKDMRLIDFQLSRLAPPVTDLLYLFCFSASKGVIDELETYLEKYYNNLSDFLKELDTDVDIVYPFKIFMGQWKDFARYGPAMILFALRFTLSEEHEAPSLASKEEFARTIGIEKMENQEEHDRRIVNVLKKFVKSGWI